MSSPRELWKETVICVSFGSCQFPGVKYDASGKAVKIFKEK